MADLSGVAAVTGAGQGIGLATVRELARRGMDVLATVPLPSMESAVRKATEGLAGGVRTRVLDVTAPGDFTFPEDLRVLVNNAGIRRDYLPIEESRPQEWRRVFDVNFFGLVETTRRAIPVLRSAGHGVICNVTSASILGPIPFLGPYRASKAAVSSFTETLRLELAPFGIRVVEVLPGATISGINVDSITRRVADAAAFPPYAPMANRQFEMNQQRPPPTPAEDAAIDIVDVIEADGGPQRYGTDEGSRRKLETWRNSTDEEILTAALAEFSPGSLRTSPERGRQKGGGL